MVIFIYGLSDLDYIVDCCVVDQCSLVRAFQRFGEKFAAIFIVKNFPLQHLYPGPTSLCSLVIQDLRCREVCNLMSVESESLAIS